MVRLLTSNATGPGSIAGWGTKILLASQSRQKKQKLKKKFDELKIIFFISKIMGGLSQCHQFCNNQRKIVKKYFVIKDTQHYKSTVLQ